jgi:hypothetical protein
MPLLPEQALQLAVCRFAKLHKIPFLHVANERKTSPYFGSLLKDMGVTPGVSDCFFPRGNGKFPGMWLELKAGKAKPTPLQIKFMKEMEAEGYFATWCQGIDAAMEIIKNFYSIS